MQNATQLPIIQIVADPSKSNDKNPNGITIGTNMRPDKADFAVMMMMGEAIRVWAQLLIDKGNSKFSATGLTLPDGSPAIIPETASKE